MFGLAWWYIVLNVVVVGIWWSLAVANHFDLLNVVVAVLWTAKLGYDLGRAARGNPVRSANSPSKNPDDCR